MEEANVVSAAYEVPTYELKGGQAWFHFLHGNVPGHQIDFIYRPKVPQPPLTRQHFSHLTRLLRYIEPRQRSAYAFAIGNLSRDDTQYEPGHGGVALIFGLRIRGAKDHAGREDPPFCHSAVLVDRNVNGEAIYGSAVQFYQKLLPDEESRAEGSGWYHTYVQYAQHPDALIPLLKGYLSDFVDLYTPEPSRLSRRWSVEKSTPPRRVVIVYPDNADFPTIAYCMARIANVLVESDIKWTAISNGREQDVPGGLTVRFIPRREATTEPSDVVLMYLEQVPEDPASIAAQLFNAYEVGVSPASDPRAGRRPAQEQPTPPSVRSAAATGTGPTTGVSSAVLKSSNDDRARPWDPPPEAPPAENAAAKAAGLGGLVQVVDKTNEPSDLLLPQRDLSAELKKKERKQQFSTLIGVGVLIVLFGVIAAVWFGTAPPKPVETGTGVASASSVSTVAPPMPSTASVQPTTTSQASASAPQEGGPITMPTAQVAGTATVKPTSGTATTSKPTSKKKPKTLFDPLN